MEATVRDIPIDFSGFRLRVSEEPAMKMRARERGGSRW
jgi:hypothetical protein